MVVNLEGEHNQWADEDILAASQTRPDLFGALVDRWQEAFFRAALSIVRQKEEAEDIVQDAFTNMYLHAGSFEKQPNASFKSWAYRIVINTAISHYRKIKRIRAYQTPLDPELYANLPGKEDFRKSSEEQILAQELLEELPEDLRRVVEAHYLEGKPYKTIADEEHIPLSTLKMRIFRAKNILKSYA